MFPSIPEQWHIDLVKSGIKENSSIIEIASAIENYEHHERKYKNQRKNVFGKQHKYDDHT